MRTEAVDGAGPESASPAALSPAQPRPAQPSPAQPSPAQPSHATPGAGLPGPVQPGPAEATTAPARIAQTRGPQAGPAQTHDAQDAPWTPPTREEVVKEHSVRGYRLAYRLTGNCHDAEDLTQEVFVRVFRSLPSYTPGTFEGWLHRITTNLFLDITRRKQRIRFEGLGEETAARLGDGGPSPAQAFDDRHLDTDIQAALKALAPEYRAAVILCDIEGLSYEEIAATLGIKLGTVRSRIHRGRAQLRAALEHRRPRHATPPQPRAPLRARLPEGQPLT